MATPSPCHRPFYPTDLTDAQWQQIQPLLPPPSSNGRPEKHPRQEIVNANHCAERTGCAWRLLPHDLPPWQTVERWKRHWASNGTLDRIHDALRDRLRDDQGRDPMVSAGIIDAHLRNI